MISIRDFALGSVSGFRRGPGSLIRWQQQAEPHGLVCKWLKVGHAITSSCLGICERGDLSIISFEDSQKNQKCQRLGRESCHFLRGFPKKTKKPNISGRCPQSLGRCQMWRPSVCDLWFFWFIWESSKEVTGFWAEALTFLVFLEILERNARSLVFRRFPSKL